MRKLIKKILKEDEFDFIRNVVPEVAEGLLLCNGDAYFDIDRIEITKVEEDKVFFTDLDTGYRYLDPLDSIMKGLKDGRWTICNPLKESDDMQWIRDVDVTVPFDEVDSGMWLQRYKLIIKNRVGFLTHLNDCGMHTLADSIDDVDYVTLVSSAQLESGQVFCGNDRKHSYTGWKHGLELKFHLNRETDSSHRWRFWVVDVGDISLAPF